MKPKTLRTISVHNRNLKMVAETEKIKELETMNLHDQVYKLRSKYIKGINVPRRSVMMKKMNNTSHLNISKPVDRRDRSKSRGLTPTNYRQGNTFGRANTINLSKKPKKQDSRRPMLKRAHSGIHGQFDEST